jgi:acetyl-CoA carboxylase biotin carboxyl carrier protein
MLQIAAWMEAAGIAEIELVSDGKAIRMRVGEPGDPVSVASAPGSAKRRHITSTGIGTLQFVHPLRKPPFVDVGDTVVKGDVVALLQSGLAYLPVTAPSDGVIGAIVAESGTRVEFGSPIFELAEVGMED